MSQAAIGWFIGALMFFSFCGNLYCFWEVAVEEERPGAVVAYQALNVLWFLLNLGIVFLILSRL